MTGSEKGKKDEGMSLLKSKITRYLYPLRLDIIDKNDKKKRERLRIVYLILLHLILLEARGGKSKGKSGSNRNGRRFDNEEY